MGEVRWMLREDGLLAWEAETWVSVLEVVNVHVLNVCTHTVEAHCGSTDIHDLFACHTTLMYACQVKKIMQGVQKSSLSLPFWDM